MSEPEYRIEFTVQRITPGDEDFVDIGFGSSGGWSTIGKAGHAAMSMLQNRVWETERWMPDPDSIPDEHL